MTEVSIVNTDEVAKVDNNSVSVEQSSALIKMSTIPGTRFA